MSGSKKEKILLLNSSHARYPLGGDSWVRATLDALVALDPGNHHLITSIGLPGWELTAWAAGRAGFSQTLVLPGEDNAAGRSFFRRCLEDFNLDSSLTDAAFTGRCGSREFRTLRDRLVFELAGIAAPVSVRPGGRLDTLLDEFISSGGKHIEQYRVPYRTGGWRPRYELDKSRLNPGLKKLGSGWLFHWTHSHPGPWPDDSPAAFYGDLIDEPHTYPRSAAATLARIVREGVIRGSSFHKAGGAMMVSLTSLAPEAAISLMRWRSRYRRWSVEAYGIAVRRQPLVRLGARQVRYFDRIPRGLPDRDRPFSQLRGKVTDWRGECEWRVRGDIRLDKFARPDIVLLTYDNHWPAPGQKVSQAYEIIPLMCQND